MQYKDYYKIMGVPKNATQDEIKRAYRKLARKYHPDVSTAVDAEARFKEVGEAYEVLKDPEKRAAYDQLGSHWKAGQEGFQPPPNWNAGFEFHGGGFTGAENQKFSDFFESLFGQFGAGQPGTGHYQARGENSHAKVFIDLQDAYQGASKTINLRSTVLDEHGRPEIKSRTLHVKVPKGVRDGQNIRLQGQGSPGFGGAAAGDLYLEIGFNRHPFYKVDGADVSLEVPIAPWEAALGATIKVPTPIGAVDLKVPPGTSSGKKMRIRGRGIPSKTPGDFFITLEIVLPDQLSDQAKSLYQALQQEAGHFNPRVAIGG